MTKVKVTVSKEELAKYFIGHERANYVYSIMLPDFITLEGVVEGEKPTLGVSGNFGPVAHTPKDKIQDSMQRQLTPKTNECCNHKEIGNKHCVCPCHQRKEKCEVSGRTYRVADHSKIKPLPYFKNSLTGNSTEIRTLLDKLNEVIERINRLPL